MLTRVVFAAALLVACRDGDPGFEIVKVPASAYGDAGPRGEGGAIASGEGGHDPVVLCIPKPEGESRDEESNDCPNEYENRSYDEKATARHRQKDDESNVCCYRKGRPARRAPDEVE